MSIGSNIDPDDALSLMHKGSLLLKQESNGLHLRWICLNKNNTFLYWLNPKRDVLKVERDSMIPIEAIDRIIISAEALALIDSEHNRESLRLSTLSFSFTIHYGSSQADIFCPNRNEFEFWISGLRSLLGKDRVIQAQISEGQTFRSHDDVEFLHFRISELVELTDSLLQEVGVMMEIRARRDRVIQFLLARQNTMHINQSSLSSSTSPEDSDSQRIIERLQDRIERQESIIKSLQDQNQSRAGKSEISNLERQLEAKNVTISNLQQRLAEVAIHQPRPTTPLRSNRRSRSRQSASRDNEEDVLGFTGWEDEEYIDYPCVYSAENPFSVNGTHIDTSLLKQREQFMENEYLRDQSSSASRAQSSSRRQQNTHSRPEKEIESSSDSYDGDPADSYRQFKENLARQRYESEALKRHPKQSLENDYVSDEEEEEEEEQEDTSDSSEYQNIRLGKIDKLFDMIDDLARKRGRRFTEEEFHRYFNFLQRTFYPELADGLPLRRTLTQSQQRPSSSRDYSRASQRQEYYADRPISRDRAQNAPRWSKYRVTSEQPSSRSREDSRQRNSTHFRRNYESPFDDDDTSSSD
ncbi:hypothetical protein BLNAU_7156 [Blattamonas nauphoetae]|uniref:PH domain-containing protein n=1 Tax=Blattamonas nauphoetae TaxID=2049346 RepID=A0ABQ9Y2N3_9EUKA|nr:hypothetical protein BLNAU_7156 [Blattamonas nauphoetae]